LRFLNKRNQAATFRVRLEKAPPGYVLSGADTAVIVAPLGEASCSLIVLVPDASFHGRCEIILDAEAMPGNQHLKQTVSFLGPDTQNQ
jgi:hypothetical protein